MAVIVIDVGSLTHGPENSLRALIDRFAPTVIFGFDPHPQTMNRVQQVGDTTVVTARKAAWVHRHGVQVHVAGSRTAISDADTETGEDDYLAESFDLCAFLAALPPVGVVLKLDVEGAEYPLLERLRSHMLDRLLDLILVEWHGPPLELPFACPVEAWTL